MVKWGAVVLIARYFSRAVEALSGKQTIAIFQTLMHIQADRYVLGTATLIAGGGYFRERRLRRKGIRERADYVKSLEQKIDPGRSSSRLLSTGESRKEDRDVI